jgi:peptidoglycan pentaglycine glycine transferase (the first glycine)
MGRRHRFAYRSCSYYENEWQTFAAKQQTLLLFACHQDRIQAVRAPYRFGEHAAEFHAGSLASSTGLCANYLLVWEALKWAKGQGCSTYDLWGIPDEIAEAGSDGNEPPVPDRTDGLWGVYQFKRGFSKRVVCYVGAYDYVYNPLLYRLASSRLLGTDVLERVSTRLDRPGLG